LEWQNYRKKTKNHRKLLTILGVYVSTEGMEELSKRFYETIQKILDTVNNNDYMLMRGDMNTSIGNNKLFCF